MPKPARIEYEGAFHHVMNRGRNHGAIFHDQRNFMRFLKCLKEASEQFDAVVHAYCLMTVRLGKGEKEVWCQLVNEPISANHYQQSRH